MFILSLIATLNFIVLLTSPHLVNAFLQHPQPSSGTFQSETNFFNSKFELCFEGDCLCSAFVTNCSSTKIFSFPPNNGVINSYHSICVILVLGKNCSITLSDNFISNIPNMRSISFDCNCGASDGCVDNYGLPFNNILHLVNNSICWLVTTSLPTASTASPTNTTTATTRTNATTTTTTTTTTITTTTTRTTTTNTKTAKAAITASTTARATTIGILLTTTTKTARTTTISHSISSTIGKESTPALSITSKTSPQTFAGLSVTAGITSGTALLQSPVKTAVCTDMLNKTICDAVKKDGFCQNEQYINLCEKSCNPACGVYTCKPGYGVGTNYTKDHFGVETCCDVIDNCDDVIAIANATQNRHFNTKYDVCFGVNSGLLFSLCSFSCGGCRISDDKLSGLDYHTVCHDNYDLNICLSLLVRKFCDVENAKEICWQTCNACKPNITPSSPETGSAKSSIWARNLPRNILKKIKEKNY